LPSPTSPLVLGCLAMPPKQDLWGDHERAPSGSGKQPTECGEDCPIRWPILDTPVKLPLENTDQVSEHHDLDVPLGLGPSTRHNETEHATQAEVEEREEHTGSCLSPPRTSRSRARSDYWCPSVEPDVFATGSGGIALTRKRPSHKLTGIGRFFNCTPRDEPQPGSGTQRNFRVPILATLKLRAACLYFLPEPSGQLPRKIPCNQLLR
jgi:hypothetical protein